MIQRLGQAFKKMAQRSMMRGNRGDAQAISEFGITGMRSNLSNQVQNKITEHLPHTALTSGVSVQENVQNVKSAVHHTDTQKQPVKNLGGNILDALK